MSGKLYDIASRTAVFLLLIEIVLITWLGSGAVTEFFSPMLVVAFASFAAVSLCIVLQKDENLNFFKKVPFWIGVAFFLLALSQSCFFTGKFVQKDTYYVIERLGTAFLPHSVDAEFSRGNAFSATSLFLAAFMFSCSVWFVSRKRNVAVLLCAFFAANVVVMAVVALAMKAGNVVILYDVVYTDAKSSYGSFTMPNSAASFITMGMMTCISLVPVAWGVRNVFFKIAIEAVLLSSAVLCVYAVFRSGSGSAYFLLPGCALFLIGIVLFFKYRKIFFACLVVAVFVCGALFQNVDSKSLGRPELFGELYDSMYSRIKIYDASLDLVKDFDAADIAFGVGGNSYRYLIPEYMSGQYGKNIMSFPHDPHSSVLLLAIEYGVAGVGLALAGALCFAKSLYDKKEYLVFSNFSMLSGVAVCLCHSFFDVHFQIPAIVVSLFGLIPLSLANFKAE